MPSRLLLAFWVPLGVMVLWLAPGQAALPQKVLKPAPKPVQQEASKANSPEAIEQKIAALAEKIKASQQAENEQTAQQLGVDLSLLKKRTELLQELRTAYKWWLGNQEKEALVEKEHTALAKNVALLKERGVKEPPPYSLSFYDQLLSQQQFFAQRQEGYALSNSLFAEHLDFLRGKREEAGKKWRLLKDKLAAAKLPQEQKKLRFEIQVVGLEKELAETEYLSSKTYKHIFAILQLMARQQTEVYRAQAAWVQKHLLIQKSDLEHQLTHWNNAYKQLAAVAERPAVTNC